MKQGDGRKSEVKGQKAKGKTANGDRMKTAAALMCVLFAAASGTAYYVATTGNDTNPGSFERPWRRVGKAAATMVAGDLVLVRGGVYYESVNPAQSGTESEPITYAADDTESVIVER
jgi:hypothetical protein